MSMDDLYLDTKLNYRLWLLACKMAERKGDDGMVIPRKTIESMLHKKGIPEKMPIFESMLPEDYWTASTHPPTGCTCTLALSRK